MLNFLTISVQIGTDTSQCSLTEENPGCGTSKTTGFLRLPLELRQKVYRLLVVPTPVRQVGIQTSILRVSKMIHKEAVKIMYGENGVVMYHVHRNVLGHLKPDVQNDNASFPSTFRVYPTTQTDGRIGSEPALTVSIALQHSCYPEQDGRWGDGFESYVGRAESLPGFCKILTSCKIRTTLHLRLSLPSVEYRTWGGRPQYLLDSFQECRGIGTAEIFAAGGLPVETDLCSLMCKPFQSFDEILSRARCYQDRVRQLLASRHHIEALHLLASAYCYLVWWPRLGIELSNETEGKWTEFWDMNLGTSLLYASQWLRRGNQHEARRLIRGIFSTYPLNSESAPVPRRFWAKEGEGHYILGLCSLVEECKSCALYEFLQSLHCKPGHERSDKEIDELEAAVKNSDIPDDEIVWWNIKHVLRRFRRQPPLDLGLDDDNHRHRGPANITEDDVNRLVYSFVRPLACKAQCYSIR